MGVVVEHIHKESRKKVNNKLTKFADVIELLRSLRSNVDYEKLSRHIIILSGRAINRK